LESGEWRAGTRRGRVPLELHRQAVVPRKAPRRAALHDRLSPSRFRSDAPHIVSPLVRRDDAGAGGDYRHRNGQFRTGRGGRLTGACQATAGGEHEHRCETRGDSVGNQNPTVAAHFSAPLVSRTAHRHRPLRSAPSVCLKSRARSMPVSVEGPCGRWVTALRIPGSVKRVASAVGEGAMEIMFVHQHLRRDNA
jgi:hypothetical protein